MIALPVAQHPRLMTNPDQIQAAAVRGYGNIGIVRPVKFCGPEFETTTLPGSAQNRQGILCATLPNRDPQPQYVLAIIQALASIEIFTF